MAEYEVYKSEAETASQQGREERSRQIYAEILCDFMFKRVFGSEENKDVLIAFLNVMLEDVKIKDVRSISVTGRSTIRHIPSIGREESPDQNTTRRTTKEQGTESERRISNGITSLIL